jgi:hypothetical protein
LSKESLLAEVRQTENVAATLGGSTDKAGRFKLLEVAGLEVVAEESLDFDTDIL